MLDFGSNLTSLGMMVATNQLPLKEKFVYKEKYQKRIIKKGGRKTFSTAFFHAITYDDKPLNANIASQRMKCIKNASLMHSIHLYFLQIL
jgi:adenosylmethionine-8-amino-7-oxononanoate aminotransferase